MIPEKDECETDDVDEGETSQDVKHVRPSICYRGLLDYHAELDDLTPLQDWRIPSGSPSRPLPNMMSFRERTLPTLLSFREMPQGDCGFCSGKCNLF